MSQVQYCYLVLLFPCCLSLQCYQCITDDESTCLNKPNLIECRSFQKGACMTVTYKTEKDGKDVTRYMKGCWRSYESCMSYCDSPESINEITQCQRKCCTTDKCNAGGLRSVYQDKTKRSTDQENGTMKHILSYIVMLLSIISFTICCII